MKIGIMLRHLNQHGGGVRVYTHNLVRHLLALDTGHQFVLLYRDPDAMGAFANGYDPDRVRELVIRPRSQLLWDQLATRRAEKREKFDLIFNPKYALPLISDCPGVFVCHGLDWYVMPWASKWIDRMNHRYLIPRYADHAAAIIAVSDTTRRHVLEYLHQPADKVHTIYLGVDEKFRRPVSDQARDRVRKQYQLPDRFFLYVGQIYPPKNMGRLLKAYASLGPARGIHLVLAGEHRWLCDHELDLIDKLNLRPWVTQTGWIEHDTLPAFYKLAAALAMPSLYEACPSPLLEAMAAGCPIVTANRYGTRDLADGVATLVDPEDIDSIADGLTHVLDDPDDCARLVTAGYQRVQQFSWDRCARQTLKVLETTAAAAAAADLH